MQHIVSRTIPSIAARSLKFARPPPSTAQFLPARSFTNAATGNKSRIPFKTITASVLLTSSAYYYARKSEHVSAEAQSPIINYLSNPATTLSELHDSSNRIAVQAKSTEELAMALFVYRLCALPWLVDVAPHLISLSEKLHLQAPVYWLVKQTFFRHFCGGETSNECISSMDRLAQSGINCILDLSVEADLHVDNDATKVEGSKYARDDQNADIITKMIKTCIETASGGVKPNSMAAIKLTAFSPPELLLRVNQVITALDQAFLEHQTNGRMDASGVRNVIEKILPPAETENQASQRQTIVQQLEKQKGTLDVIEFRKLFSLQGQGRDVWWKTTSEDSKAVLLTAEDLSAYDRMINRLEQVCSLAHDLKVGIMVDAEQSYFQDAIDHVAVNLQRKYNKRIEGQEQQPTVYNTYQMYTKSAQGRMELDVEKSKRENFTFAAKLVRGAYMVSERRRAQEMSYNSPIHETLEDTHASYNGGVKFLLEKIDEYQKTTNKTADAISSPIVFMVASHNRDSVILTIEEMERNNVSPHAGVVHFGQLFGMKDQLSYTLGRNGYSIYKYLPYGMIDEVIPYLLRRAQENSSVLGGVAVERQLMWEEVKSRITGKAPSVSSSDVSITTPNGTTVTSV